MRQTLIDKAIAKLEAEREPHAQQVKALNAAIQALQHAQTARKAERKSKPRVVKPSGEAA
jgi:hypothetical protein